MLSNICNRVWVLLSCVAIQALARSEAHVQPATTVGGPHGKGFDDIAIIKDNHHRLRRITLSPCEVGARLTYVKFEYAVSTAKDAPITHFSEHGTLQAGKQTQTLELADQEYVGEYIGYPIKVKAGLTSKTRLSGLSFTSNLAQNIACGTKQSEYDQTIVSAGTKRAFLYFTGAAGDVIDNLTGQTIPVEDYF